MARLAKLEYEKQAGKLLNADDVENALAIIVRATRDRLLALPYRLAEAVAVETNPAEVHNLLNREVRETLLELSDALLNRFATGTAAKGSSEADSSEVGSA